MSQPYLFYSEKCPHSKQIIETLKALNKTSLYKFILVESLARNQIPGFLKKVPTLYNPESKEVVVGKDIFGYIAKPTNSRKELPVKEEQQQPGTIGNISAWGFEGAGTLSESFSDWNAPSSFSSDGNSMYTFLGGGSVSGPPEPKSENTLSKEKGGASSEIASRMEALQIQRKSEFNGIQRK